ncbi:MAG: hypothetical protein LC798_05300 [Chloroflexi bacterium]|nr:hypothetical protein [Chloroflexota bacterium]
MTGPQAKRAVMFGGAVATGLTALQWSTEKGGIVPMRIVVGGLLGTAAMLALADWQPDLGGSLALLVLLTSLLTSGRVELLKRIGGSL